MKSETSGSSLLKGCYRVADVEWFNSGLIWRGLERMMKFECRVGFEYISILEIENAFEVCLMIEC